MVESVVVQAPVALIYLLADHLVKPYHERRVVSNLLFVLRCRRALLFAARRLSISTLDTVPRYMGLL
jgi:hypothetical protein